jgi:hypothetical protein
LIFVLAYQLAMLSSALSKFAMTYMFWQHLLATRERMIFAPSEVALQSVDEQFFGGLFLDELFFVFLELLL